MKCVNVSPVIEASRGIVTSCIDFDVNRSIQLPYRSEYATLIGKDFGAVEEVGNILTHNVQACPYCSGVLHLSSSGTFCYNVHCPASRIIVIQQQLGRFGVQLSKIVLENVITRMSRDPYYDMIGLFGDYRITFGEDLFPRLKNMSIADYLFLIRLSDVFEEEIEDLSSAFSDSLPHFFQALYNGYFDHDKSLVIDPDLRAAINLSVRYVNISFAINVYLAAIS